MEFKPERKESEPIVENVRVALVHRGKFLVLEKSPDSKNPGALEFAGGKVDEVTGSSSTEEEQKVAAYTEILEETGIDVRNFPMEHVDDYKTYFEATGKDGIKKEYRRLVHLWLVRLPDGEEFPVTVSETTEDKHSNYHWLSQDELISAATTLEENPHTEKKQYMLAKNSRPIKKLLERM